MANPGDDNELIKAAVEGVARGVTDSVLEPFKLMAGGFCREIGAGLGYVGTYFRIKIGLKVMERARLMLREAGVEGQSVAPKVFVPLIESASLEEDDDLQERWAALLANAADPKQEDVPASFPGILKDLSPQEAKLLDAIYGDPRQRPNSIGPANAYWELG